MLILPLDKKEVSMHGRLKKRKKKMEEKKKRKAEAISADSEAGVTTVLHL